MVSRQSIEQFAVCWQLQRFPRSFDFVCWACMATGCAAMRGGQLLHRLEIG